MDLRSGWEERNREQFDGLAGSYDRLGFLTLAAHAVAARVPAGPGDTVLDVMTGTGTVALALAKRVQPGGRVVGADLSGGMLEVALTRAAGAAHVSFVQADAAALPFADAAFDAVVCASGLFFMPDMVGALRKWGRVVQPGGAVVVSVFGRGLLGPLPGLWRARLGAHGHVPGSPPLGRVPTPDAARDLLLAAGLAHVTAEVVDVPYTVPDVASRWADIVAGLEGQALAEVPPDVRARVEAEHRAELAPLFASGPLTVPVPVIVATGRGA